MKKSLLTLLAVYAIYILVGNYTERHPATTVRAYGDLAVAYLGVPLGDPIFSVNNIAPGGSESRTVQVTNSGIIARYIAIKGLRTGPAVPQVPPLETGMNLAISGDATYGAGDTKTLLAFFADSSAPNGILLGIVAPGATKNYTITGTLPTTAENEFQNKTVVFDLSFGIVAANHLVVNEVYYQVDSGHGVDGSESSNKKGQNTEWIEIFNPTGSPVTLKNWTITDNEGTFKINANKSVGANGFALLSKDASGWRYWDENAKAGKIEMGKFPKLDNSDHILLINPSGTLVDAVGWGSDTFVWTPAITGALLSSSLERLVPGFDNNVITDWLPRTSPTPGL